MEYKIYFNVAAFFLMLVFLVTTYLKENDHSRLNTILKLLMGCNFAAVAIDIVCCFWPRGIFDKESFNQMLIYLYYISHALVHLLTCFYTMALITGMRYQKELCKFIVGIFVAAGILLLLNPFTQKLFTFAEDGLCQRQWGLIYECFAMELMLALSFVWAYRGRKMISRRQWLALCCCLVSQMAGILFSMYFPRLMAENLMIASGLLLLGSSARNTEHTINYETKALSSHAFSFRFAEKCLLEQPFCMILIYCRDWEFYARAFGFEVGEYLLRAISLYLRKMFTDDDVFYFGNEVFGVIFNDYDHYGYHKYISQMKKHFEQPWEVKGYHICMEANFLGLRYLEDFFTEKDVMDCISGLRNTAFSTDLVVLKKSRLVMKDTERIYKIKKLLHKAVLEDGFDVYYQPIYSTHEKRIVSAEALVRLKDTQTMGFVSPEEFIPIAEQTGQIIPLGEIVFEKVCRFIREENIQEQGIEYIEVNLSTIQCMEDNLVKKLTEIMQKYDIRPEQINLEITETAKINSMEYVRKNMNYLKEKKISFSLDDYGSGNANLNYLLEFSFDIAKIDKFVLWNAFSNPKYMETLECTIQMLKKLGVRMVMEGVETEEQKKKLEELKCDYFQGYYFSRPLSDRQFVEYLKTSEYAIG